MQTRKIEDALFLGSAAVLSFYMVAWIYYQLILSLLQ